MKRITVSLPDDLAEAVARESRILHKTVSEIVRRSLSKDLEVRKSQPRRVSFIGIGSSGRDWSEMDAELEKSWPKAIREHEDK
jgi:hypothetical protein